jgi:hypothetical protein
MEWGYMVAPALQILGLAHTRELASQRFDIALEPT